MVGDEVLSEGVSLPSRYVGPQKWGGLECRRVARLRGGPVGPYHK